MSAEQQGWILDSGNAAVVSRRRGGGTGHNWRHFAPRLANISWEKAVVWGAKPYIVVSHAVEDGDGILEKDAENIAGASAVTAAQ